MSEPRTEQSKSYLTQPEIHAQWESDYLNPDLDAFYDLCFGRIVEKLAIPAEPRILDAGCGYGFHAMRLASQGLRVVGVDFSQSALQVARTNVERAGMADRVSLQQADLLALPFEAESFSYVNCWGVLMHIPDLEQALGELCRVLKPGGKLVLTENNVRALDVVVLERAIRLVKRVLGRRLNERRRTPRGIEEWVAAHGESGLLVRKTDMRFLEQSLNARGLRLVDRFASQFTEVYTNMPTPALKRAVYAFNTMWFKHVKGPRLAMGNTLIFEKHLDAQ